MRKVIILLTLITFASCKSTKLVDNYKNPDNVVFTAYKVLVVGMISNEETRVDFETRLKREFDERNVEAMRSMDLFDVEFTSSSKTEDELAAVEQQLLEKDFDAIIFTKVVGLEHKQSLTKSIEELGNYTGRFRDDYVQHQNIYIDANYYDSFKIYHTETVVYCICEGKERSMVWRGSIDIKDPKNIQKSIDEYIHLVVNAMEEQDVIFRKK
tara:strand:+ start:143590 stop:144225 length:636 start_codon:yes stop_codon:yes gene_type:complete